MKPETIFLVGNPNTGKTTLFNQLTGLQQKTGNFHGVTVEKKTGTMVWKGQSRLLTDLPGTLGSRSQSLEKRITHRELLSRNPEDKAIYVLDPLALERGLQFLMEIIDMGIPTLVVITMKDVVNKRKIQIDLSRLQDELGLEVVFLNAKSKEDLSSAYPKLFDPDCYRQINRKWQWDEPREDFFQKIQKEIGCDSVYSKYILNQALKQMGRTSDSPESFFLESFSQETRNFLASQLESSGLVFDYQAELVQKAVAIRKIVSSVIETKQLPPPPFQKSVDAVLMHPIWGLGFFFLLMAFLFQSLFLWAEVPMKGIEMLVQWFQSQGEKILPSGPLQSLVVDGILGGVGTVITFLPQIGLLFFFLGLLEESGYMARASYVLDRFMGRFGLSGKSFIPLLSSAACAVPAILGTRTIENKSDRFTTILISPLVMCSARYPIYILVVGTVFPPFVFGGMVPLQGIVLFGMFFLGILTALCFGFIFRRTFFKSQASTFLMEIPEYRLPSLKSVSLSVFTKIKSFLSSAGQIILYISVVLWFLSHFPGRYEEKVWKASPMQESYAAQIGKQMEPWIAPLGYDWKIGLSLVTSFAAREVMVSTLAILYESEEETPEESISLRESMRADKRQDGSFLWTPLTGISLLCFFAFASQCMSTLAVVKKETGSVLWAGFQFFYMTSLAYTSAFLVYQLGRALGFS